MSFDSVRASTLPYRCVEAQAYTTTQNDSEKLEHGWNNDVDRIIPISKAAGSSQWAGRDPLHLAETKPLNVSRKIHDDPPITSVPTRPRNPTKTQLSYSSGEPEPENSIEYNPLTTSSVTTSQDGNTLTRAHNRPQSQKPRETGRVSRPRKHNEDLPPLPTQDTSSSSSGPRFQYPQEIHTSYSQDLDVPPSIPSVPSEERNQYNSPQTRSRTQQPRVTRISFANKPWDSNHLEPPSLRIQEKSQSNYSRTHSQPQETLSIPWDLDRLESPSLPIQEKSQSDYSRTQSQPEETQVSSDVNKLQDRAEHPKDSTPTRDQDQDPSADAGETDTRPHLIRGTPSQMDTQYVNMLLALDDIPQLHNMFAGFFNWILLAGFLLFPGTFTSLKNLGGNSSQVAQLLVNAVTSIPLFVIAWLCTGVGATGMLWLWWRWRRNYIWALNKIFLPGAMNSLAGFISTMANVFGAQHGELSTTSKITIIVTATSTGVLGILTAIYSFWLVKRVKSQHDKTVGKERTGKHGEGVIDLSKRKVEV